ncbi:hypothetical protein CK203_103626 [Vitis vinifera]|uniref:Uncharacterized protein n=1 Tax=Vitis vinifera TaxID=29760 RepID=A0A438BPX5_VITVI|nr:hypothetical protein CK203_103626 [Vitis vinifera]
MHPHIYLILPLSADTIRGEHLPRLWPLLRFHLGVLLQRKPKTSEPGESSRAPQDSQSQPPPTRRPIASSPIEGNSDCQSRAFMSRHILTTLFCDSSLSCRIHTTYLRSTILQIAEAFHIPYAPADPLHLDWAPLSEWDMVCILSRGTSSEDHYEEELPLGCS